MIDGQTDPLDDALDDLRVSGSVLLHECYAPPWAIAVPDERRLRTLLQVQSDLRVLVFHYVRRESFDLTIAANRPVTVGTSELAICPSGDAHLMSRGIGSTVMPLEAILRRESPARVDRGTKGATECVCGVFVVRAAPLNPMLSALPPIIKVATSGVAVTSMLAGVTELLARELDRGALNTYTAARLLEVLCAEAIRAYQHSEGSAVPGWFKGLADPRVAIAIRQIHAEPSTDWTVGSLASRVALSPSRFAARFRELTGQSVMHYVARWRANIACRMLTETNLQLGEIANRAGYDSLPAFSRAFKHQLGLPPAAWRAERQVLHYQSGLT